nr:hypothetical protein [Tanacetum cinerariifolium]
MLASMLSPTDSTFSGGGTDGGTDGESGMDLLRDKDGNSDEIWVWSDSAVSLRSSFDESSPESSGWPYKAGVRFVDDGAGLMVNMSLTGSYTLTDNYYLIDIYSLTAAINMSLTDINASLTENNLHQQCKLFSRGNSSTQQWEHFF